MTRSHRSPNPSAHRTVPRAPWRRIWLLVGRPVSRQWWFPTSLRPAVLRAFGGEVDDQVVIREDVCVVRPWHLRIDGPAWIGHGVVIDHDGDVTVERDVCLGRNAVLGSAGRGDTAPIVLRRGAWIAAEAHVNAGGDVGEHAVVGAGTEVHGIVEPGSIARPAYACIDEDVVAP